MRYKLYKRVETHLKGCPEDESVSAETSTSYHLVSDEQEKEFQENLANDYGYQDYNYQFVVKPIATFYDIEDVKDLITSLIDQIQEMSNKKLQEIAEKKLEEKFGKGVGK